MSWGSDNEEMIEVERADQVEIENEIENDVQEPILDEDDRESYLSAVLNIRLDFVKTLRSSRIAGKYADKLERSFEEEACMVQRLQLEVEHLKGVQVGMEMVAAARSGGPFQQGSGEASKQRTVVVEEPKYFGSLFSEGAAQAPAGSRGVDRGSVAMPAAAVHGTDHSRGQHALLIYPKKSGFSAGVVLKENFDPVSLNLGAVSRAVRGGGVAAELQTPEKVVALQNAIEGHAQVKDLLLARPPARYKPQVKIFGVDQALGHGDSLDKLKMQNSLQFADEEVKLRMGFQERFTGNCTWSLDVSPRMSQILLGRGMVNLGWTR